MIKEQKLFLRGTKHTEDGLAISAFVHAVGYKLATHEDNAVCRRGSGAFRYIMEGFLKIVQ